MLLISKPPFPNGSYRNGVCRALWARCVVKKWYKLMKYSTQSFMLLHCKKVQLGWQLSGQCRLTLFIALNPCIIHYFAKLNIPYVRGPVLFMYLLWPTNLYVCPFQVSLLLCGDLCHLFTFESTISFA